MTCKQLKLVRIALVVCAIGCFQLWDASGYAATQDTGQVRLVQDNPGLTGGVRVEPGVIQYQVSLQERGHASKLFVYVPENEGAKKVPCILIGPAGTHLIEGAEWGAKDDAANEHLPYVRAGYAVVVYSLDGDMPDHPTGTQIVAAARAFKAAEAGLANARAALDFALARVPNIDASRIYTAGHSSAATLSLLVAEHEPRVKGCIAYAPVCNLPRRLGEHDLKILDGLIPGYREYIRRSSPDTGAESLKCPVFLFHADDDTNVPTAEVTAFVDELRHFNQKVTFVRVPTGGHYLSMVRQGIPQAIRWLDALQRYDHKP